MGGSMLLAGLLIKIGVLGVLIVSVISLDVRFLLFALISIGIFVRLVKMMISSDLKVIIAYSSVVHMGILLLGLILNSLVAVFSAMLVILFHSFVSSSLFYLVGIISNLRFRRRLFIIKRTLL